MPTRVLAVLCAFCLLATSAGTVAATPDAGMRMVETEHYADARAWFGAALHRDPADAAATADMVKLELATGDDTAAVRWAQKAVALAPRDAESYLLLGYAYSRYINDVGLLHKFGIAHRILAAFRQGVALAPGDADAHADLAGYYIAAPGIVGGGKARAEQQIAALMPLDPVRANALKAMLADKHGHAASADRDMHTAARIDATGNGAYYLGMYLVARQRYADAYAAFEEGIQENPGNSRNYYQLGRVAALTGTHVAAGISALQAYLRMPHRWQPDTPTYKWARYQLGSLFALAGEPGAAKAQYQAALAMDPDFQQASRALEAM